MWHYNCCKKVRTIVRMRVKFLYIILSCVCSLMVTAQQAEPQRTPEEEAAKQTEMLVRILPNLTDTQKFQLTKIHLRYIQERIEYPERTTAIERMKRRHEEYRTILTENQYKLLQNKCSNNAPHTQTSTGITVPIHYTRH